MGHDRPFELPAFADLPQMHELLAAWDSWRASDVVPLRSKVKLSDIDRFLSHAMLLDMEPSGRIHCRYIGSKFQEIYGHDFTGEDYLEITDARYRDTRSKRLFTAANHPCIAVWSTKAEGDQKGLPNATGASLPIRPDVSGKPIQLLQVVVALEDFVFSEFATQNKREKIAFSDQFSLIDTGAGVPDIS